MKAKTAIKLESAEEVEPKEKKSFVNSILYDFFIAPPFLTVLTYINIATLYFLLLAAIRGHQVQQWYLLLYFPLFFFIDVLRKSKKEKERIEVAHRIPFFADALANSLSVGSTIEHSFLQASYYLTGKIKREIQALPLKIALGQNMGKLLRELEEKFPNTGLMYLISLLDAYSELGVGISPLLKRISIVLTEKERAEEKVRTILSSGSSYARLTIGIFGVIFLSLAFLMKKQVEMLFSPVLKPTLIFLSAWTFVGILIVTRISALDFSRNFALRPFIKNFIKDKKFDEEQLMKYSGMEWSWGKRQVYEYGPMIVGFFISYLTSWFYEEATPIVIAFIMGTLIIKYIFKFILKGLVEEQLIATIEIFPDILQVFIIGLNSGLNSYLAFQFAQNAFKGGKTKLLLEELSRTNFAMECGEDHSRTWQNLSEKLPFETVVDFCKIMVVAPMAGESIVSSIVQMTSGYQDKKLKLIEKKAGAISQFVIPIIIMIFMPLFLFIMFGPLVISISSLLDMKAGS